METEPTKQPDDSTGAADSALAESAGSAVMTFDDECILHFAMRYALGRRSTAPGIVCKVLKRDWPILRQWTRDQMQREIREAINDNLAGDQCDVNEWGQILMLPNVQAHVPLADSGRDAERKP